jgi:hypothetical protein
MIEFIFVSVLCMGPNQCEFFTSNKPITEARCQQLKDQFLNLPFKSEVTVAAAQCMTFNGGVKI